MTVIPIRLVRTLKFTDEYGSWLFKLELDGDASARCSGEQLAAELHKHRETIAANATQCTMGNFGSTRSAAGIRA